MPVEVFLPLSILCATAVLFRYYQIRRLTSGIGWALMIVAIGSFGSGLAESFAWSGFAFLFIAALGMMIVIQDALIRRQSRRTRRKADNGDFKHHI